MNIGHYQFRPPLWASLLVIGVIMLTFLLGAWQLRRGDDKAAMLAGYDAASLMPPVPINSASASSALQELQGRRIRVRGRLLNRQLLHDNQVHDRQPGYHVWSVLETDAGGPLYVLNRGWVPAGASRDEQSVPAVPGGIVEVTGLWRSLPRPGLRLGEQPCPARRWPAVVQYPRASDLECLLGRPVHEGLLLMDPDHSDGFVRRWRDIGIQPERHYGYAFQWFALGVVLSILFVVANLERPETIRK